MSFYSGFAPFYEQLFPFREDLYLFLRGYAGCSGGAVLDAGCGPGHYCCRFIGEGFRVTGIDLDQQMINVARASCRAATFRCTDIAAPDAVQGSFQLIYSTGNVIAHLSPERLVTFLDNVYEALDTGGYWIFQVVNWDYLLTLQDYTFPVRSFADGSSEFHRRYSLISPEEVVFDVRLLSGGETVFSEHSRLYPLTSDVFVQLHLEAGFALEALYAGFDCSEFHKERNSAMIMVFGKR